MTDVLAEFAAALDTAREPTADGLDAQRRLVELGPLVLGRLRDAEHLADGRLRALTALGRIVDELQHANESHDAAAYGHLDGHPEGHTWRGRYAAYVRADGMPETETEYRARVNQIKTERRSAAARLVDALARRTPAPAELEH